MPAAALHEKQLCHLWVLHQASLLYQKPLGQLPDTEEERVPTASQERAVRSPERHRPAKEALGAVASVSHVLNSHSEGEAHVQSGSRGGLSSGPLPISTCHTGPVEGPCWAQTGRAGLAQSLDTRRGWI